MIWKRLLINNTRCRLFLLRTCQSKPAIAAIKPGEQIRDKANYW